MGTALGLSALGIVGVLAALAVPGHAGVSKTTAHERAAVTKVAVSATEFRFKLSKTRVPTGVVAFVVTNRGKIVHDFFIAGKRTKRLAPGKSQTIRVTFKKSGRFLYVCTVPGHAAAGMKGTLAVGKATVPKPPPTTTTTPPTTTTVATPPPGSTQIQVSATEFAFALTQTSVPVGTTVFFSVANKGQVAHDFVFPSLGGATTGLIQPGQTGTLTITFKTAGQVYYDCDLPQHAEAGMAGFFTVTG
jgi:uncharacterized cupredoxin-like copper-binding protein